MGSFLFLLVLPLFFLFSPFFFFFFFSFLFRASFEKILKDYPGNYDSLVHYAYRCQSNGEYSKAIDLYKKAFGFERHDPIVEKNYEIALQQIQDLVKKKKKRKKRKKEKKERKERKKRKKEKKVYFII